MPVLSYLPVKLFRKNHNQSDFYKFLSLFQCRSHQLFPAENHAGLCPPSDNWYPIPDVTRDVRVRDEKIHWQAKQVVKQGNQNCRAMGMDFPPVPFFNTTPPWSEQSCPGPVRSGHLMVIVLVPGNAARTRLPGSNFSVASIFNNPGGREVSH